MQASQMKKYYVGLFVLVVLVVGSLLYTISQASNTKSDSQTNKVVDQIDNKLDIYISDQGIIPASLSDAGINNSAPLAVKYTRLDNSEYRVCINYKSSSGTFNAGWTSLFTSFLTNYPGSQSGQQSTNNTYFDPTVESDHKKGENCQTVKPSDINTNNSSTSQDSNNYNSSSNPDTQNPYTVCNEGYNYAVAALTVTSITPASATSDAEVSVKSYPSATYKIASNAKVFTLTCQPLSLSNIQVGDMVSLYFSPYGSPVSLIIKE